MMADMYTLRLDMARIVFIINSCMWHNQNNGLVSNNYNINPFSCTAMDASLHTMANTTITVHGCLIINNNSNNNKRRQYYQQQQQGLVVFVVATAIPNPLVVPLPFDHLVVGSSALIVFQCHNGLVALVGTPFKGEWTAKHQEKDNPETWPSQQQKQQPHPPNPL